MGRGALIILAWAAVSATVANAGAVNVWGIGNDSCGSWTQDRQQQAKTVDSTALAGVRKAWMEGYLTAKAEDRPLLSKGATQTDTDGMAAWIDNYCAAHPLDTLFDATEELAITLAKQK